MSDEADFLSELCQRQGVSVATVKDGHVLMFKRSYLQEIIDKNSDQENLVIFIKRSDFQS